MKKIFFGFIFLFFNLNIQDGHLLYNLLPDCVGYILLLLGSLDLLPEAGAFSRVPIPAAIGAIYSVISWVIDARGISLPSIWLTNLLTLGNLLFSLWVSYLVIHAILQLETHRGNLGGCVLLRRWRFCLLFQCLTYIISIFLLMEQHVRSVNTVFSMLAAICSVPTLVFYVLVCISVYQAWKQYDRCMPYPPHK